MSSGAATIVSGQHRSLQAGFPSVFSPAHNLVSIPSPTQCQSGTHSILGTCCEDSELRGESGCRLPHHSPPPSSPRLTGFVEREHSVTGLVYILGERERGCAALRRRGRGSGGRMHSLGRGSASCRALRRREWRWEPGNCGEMEGTLYAMNI